MNGLSIQRLAHRLYLRRVPFVPALLTRLLYVLSNCYVPYEVSIGEDSKLAYFGIGVVVHSRTRIGRRVVIGQNVTIGRQLAPDSIPTIGDNVYIGPGVRILGGIHVSDNVIIGANSVVIRDVPPNSVVAGVPAKVIRSVDCDIYSLLKNVYPVVSADCFGVEESGVS